MDAWFTATCQLFTPEFGAVLTVICAVLAVLLLTLIVLGFGRLRGWLGVSIVQRPPHHPSAPAAEGLRSIWQLYRQLGRAASNPQ